MIFLLTQNLKYVLWQYFNFITKPFIGFVMQLGYYRTTYYIIVYNKLKSWVSMMMTLPNSHVVQLGKCPK